VSADGIGDSQNVLQIGTAVFIRRRTDGNEDDVAMGDRCCGIGGELQASFLVVLHHHRGQTRFENRDLPLIEAIDLGAVDIDTNDLIAHFSQAGARDQTDIPGTEYSNFHADILGF